MYDELKEKCRACSQGCIYPSDCSYFDKPPLRCMRQLLSEAADAIEELTALSRRQEVELVELTGELASKPRWIPVSERLPEEDGCYLVAVKNDHQRRYSKTAWFSHGSWFARQDVTHWQPLPKPPKEE